MAGHRTVQHLDMGSVPSSREPGPFPPAYTGVRPVFVDVIIIVVCRVRWVTPTVFSRTADLLHTIGDREVVPSKSKCVNKVEDRRRR